MSNLEITNNDINGVVIWEPVFQDDLITFAGVATLLAGTILARDSVSLKLVPYVKGGSTNENGIPKVVLTQAVTSTGAGDFPARPAVSGQMRLSKMVINADGDASNIDAAVIDQLRDFTILSISTTELSQLDNQ